jgi:hypothetical protein
MSHDFIDAWMESRTEDAYKNMRDGMDASGHRSDAEKALNDIKATLAAQKTQGSYASPTFEEQVNAVIAQYGDVPGVAKALEPLRQALGDANVSSTNGTGEVTSESSGAIKLSGGDIDNWSKAISDCVDYLGKQDQLGMINLGQLNSEINRAEQTASVLKDSRNKTAEAIINRIG